MSWAKNNFLYITLAALIVLVSALNFIPEAKDAVKSLLLRGDSRKILSQVEGDLTGHGDRFQILKVKSMDSLSLEIYTLSDEDRKVSFKSRIVLPDRKDGYFDYHGQSTNLVLADIDGDGSLEIIAPTFDENISPRLNVYKFKPADQSFEKIEARQFL